MDIVTVQNLKKYFGTGPLQVKAVDGIDLSIEKGKLTAVIGASGSGKTTLLNLIGGLYQPTEGTVTVDGVDLGTLREEELTVFRRRRVGFVFQDCSLVPELTVRENILLYALRRRPAVRRHCPGADHPALHHSGRRTYGEL